MKFSTLFYCIFLCFFSVQLMSQDILFDKKGKLLTLNTKDNKIPAFTSTDFNAMSNAEKQKVREIIIEKIADAITKLSTTDNKVNALLKEIWTRPTPDEIKKELEKLKLALETDAVPALTDPALTPINDLVKDHLLSTSPNIFAGSTGGNGPKLSIIKKDAFNDFIISYYKATINGTITQITLSELLDYTNILAAYYKEGSDLSKKIYEAKGEVTITLYKEIVNFTNKIEAGNTLFTKSKSLLNKDWFKQWFWIKGGELQLNPLDFSTDEFLAKFPRYDLAKGEIFNAYIDAVIQKYMLYDTIGKVNDFKKILAQRGTGNEQFELADRQNMITANNAGKKNQLTHSIVLNDVEIPAKGNFHTISASDGFTGTNNKEEVPTDPKRSGEIKTIVVHNVSRGSKASILETSSPIKDQSKFQADVDTIAGLIGVVAGYTTTFGAISNALSGFFSSQKNSNGIIEAGVPSTFLKIIPGARTNASIPYFNPELYIIDSLLKKRDLYEPAVFSAQIRLPKYSSLRQIQPLSSLAPGSSLETLIKEFVVNYNIALKTHQEPAIKTLEKDSMLLAGILPVFANATLPPKKIQSIDEKDPVYYSKILKSKKYDEPSKVEATPIIVKGTDTTKLDPFTFKVGKTYRFQVSAGLVYTTSNFIQSTAKEEGGKVVIENTAQQFRLAVGLHIHLGKGLFLQDNRFAGNFLERSSVYIGVGIPKPLENVYVGYSYDFFPGLKTIAGAHIYRNDKYTIQNNSITDRRTKYEFAGPFVAIQIDPASLLKALNFIPKK